MNMFFEYLSRVKSYLNAHEFEIQEGVSLLSQRIDLFGIKEIKIKGYPIQQSCSILVKEDADTNYLDQFSKENLDFASSALKSELPFPVIITYPVIISSIFSDELIKKVMKFKPDPLNRWGVKRVFHPKLSHPVLVNINNKQIYHNKGYIIGIPGYRTIFNQFVTEALSF